MRLILDDRPGGSLKVCCPACGRRLYLPLEGKPERVHVRTCRARRCLRRWFVGVETSEHEVVTFHRFAFEEIES